MLFLLSEVTLQHARELETSTFDMFEGESLFEGNTAVSVRSGGSDQDRASVSVSAVNCSGSDQDKASVSIEPVVPVVSHRMY